MSRARTGSLEKLSRKDGRPYYRVRIRLADGSRTRVDVPDKYATAERAELYALAVQEREGELGELLAAKKARHAKEAAEHDASHGETVALWSNRWLQARTARGLRSVGTDRSRLAKYILPALGSTLIASVTRDALEQMVEVLDGRVHAGALSWKSASHVWGLTTRMFADACGAKQRDLRVRKDNPAFGIHGPDRGVRKSKVYLWPAEFSQLAACSDVPLQWRRAFAVTTYLYVRAGEGNALEWSDVDLERRIVHIHRSVDRDTGEKKPTKTSVARRVPIEPEFVPLLQAMRDEANGACSISTRATASYR